MNMFHYVVGLLFGLLAPRGQIKSDVLSEHFFFNNLIVGLQKEELIFLFLEFLSESIQLKN
jgi:hypothetical protein